MQGATTNMLVMTSKVNWLLGCKRVWDCPKVVYRVSSGVSGCTLGEFMFKFPRGKRRVHWGVVRVSLDVTRQLLTVFHEFISLLDSLCVFSEVSVVYEVDIQYIVYVLYTVFL